jgi:glycosyltransferase involved in cell wall biosynthesis
MALPRKDEICPSAHPKSGGSTFFPPALPASGGMTRINVIEGSKVGRIAFIGNYLPRKCGIATFTSDLLTAVAAEHPASECFSVSMNDIADGYEYPDVVRFEIEEQDLSSYLRAADFLNIGNVDVVCVQHEFGIFGGPAGSHILALLRELRMPIVVTLHTVLQQPRTDQRLVMQELISLATRLVVMSARGRQMLQDIYHAPPAKIDLIHHGIPDMPLVDPNDFKEELGLTGRTVLFTFGLLSPNKGIEHVLNALPAIAAEFPDVVYMVVGATHPNEFRDQGEAYRVSLEILAAKNKVERNVIFYNSFVDLETLKDFISATDVYITPYLNEAQSTSGTLAYTFGSGKPVVSTPYWHAAELLADGRGVLVPFGSAESIAKEVCALLRDGARREAMRSSAYALGREMVWSNVARLYMRSFELSRLEALSMRRKSLSTKTLDQRPRETPEVRLDHLRRMTDSTGIYQHAVFSVPNFAEGYCTDDNARAFILAVMLEELGQNSERVRSLATTYAAFLCYAFDRASGRFHNLLSFDRRWLDQHGSEDCHARALWALGVGVGGSAYRSFQVMAGQLFVEALPAVSQFTSPRAWAFALIGIHEYLRRLSGDSAVTQARDDLMARLMDLYTRSATPDWPWFEQELSYDNAKLAHALILSGRAAKQPAICERGLETLRWLVRLQTSEHGHFRPIGSNGFFPRGGSRANFDQQPIEAQAMMSACLEAYRSTSDSWWLEQAQRAFDWFVGWNDLGLELYAPRTGGCCDGLHVDRVNRNQGAESTLAFLMSLAELRLTRNLVTSFRAPIVVEN